MFKQINPHGFSSCFILSYSFKGSAVAGVYSAAKEKHENGVKVKDFAISAGVTAAVYAGIYLPFLVK